MATYYVKKIETQWKYRVNEWPDVANGTNATINNIQTSLMNIGTGGHTVVIFPGRYTGADLSPSGTIATGVGTDNQRVRRPLPIDGATYVTGEVIFDGATATSNYIYEINKTGHTLNHVILTNMQKAAGYGFRSTVAVAACDDLKISNCPKGALLSGGGTFNNLYLKDIRDEQPIYFQGTALTWVFNNLIVDGSHGRTGYGYIKTPNTGSTLIFNNPIFKNFYGSVIDSEIKSTDTVTINNPIFAHNINSDLSYVVYEIDNMGSDVPWVINNPMLNPRTERSTQAVTNGPFTVTNAIKGTPCWKQTAKRGFLSFSFDDSSGFSSFRTVALLAETYGFRVGFGLSYYDNTSINWGQLHDLVISGHEVLCHTRSDVALKHENCVTASKAGSTIVVSITRGDLNDSSTWTGTLQLDALSPIDLASTSYDSIKKVATYLQAQGVTLANPSEQYDFISGADHHTKSLCLASATYAINTTKTILFDALSLAVVEIYEAKAWAEEVMRDPAKGNIPGYVATGFVYSMGYQSSFYGDHVLSAGFLYGRATNSDTLTCIGTDLRKLPARGLQGTFLDYTKDTEHYLSFLADTQGCGAIYSHNTANWDTMFTAVKASTVNVFVGTPTSCVQEMLSDYDHVTGGVAYIHASGTAIGPFTEVFFDYHLQPNSPCIGSGLAIAGITTDIEGNQLYPPYNIGPYGAAAGALDRTQPTTRTKDAKIKKYLKVPA